MRKIISYIRIVLQAGAAVIYYWITRYNRYSKNPTKYPLDKRYKYARKVMSKVLRAFKVEYHVEGLEKVKALDSKCLFICNHHSDADPLVIADLLEKPVTFVAKEESLNFPFVGKVIKSIEGIPIDRKNVMNQLQEIKQIVGMIKNEEKPNVAIFAEGTRNKHPENDCLEFKGGSIKLGYMANVPIIPVAIYGTFRILSKKHFLRRYPIYVKFFDPITPEQYKDVQSVTMADQIRKDIDKQIDEYRTLDKRNVLLQHLPRRRKIKEIQIDYKKSMS